MTFEYPSESGRSFEEEEKKGLYDFFRDILKNIGLFIERVFYFLNPFNLFEK